MMKSRINGTLWIIWPLLVNYVYANSPGDAAGETTMTYAAGVLLADDLPMTVRFFGPPEAELFSREIAESFKGTLEKNCQTTTDPAQAGFVSSSIDGRPWTGTMWSRDAGTYLRELVHFGCFGRAKLVSDYLIRFVAKNGVDTQCFPST